MPAPLFAPNDRDRLTEIELGPSPAPARILSGAPETSELILHEAPGLEIGVWEVTPGAFRSTKQGISEFMVFLAGRGTITRESGEVVAIEPDAFVSLPDGSEVVWDVVETVRKVYVITDTTPAVAR
ncbi:cupin domain-containing protein [Leucobacter allii]|uniref:Cupin domain-containing protein n=1 Tax=Leucobacter allii TaxID=2932247 RepID=A0ABY4FNQ9_9MICO|nr:cupin domain-containing protein [Leucobacter allii]UOQ57920.1 cupin domain-containing protein [Leucobacter allii]